MLKNYIVLVYIFIKYLNIKEIHNVENKSLTTDILI